MKFILSTSVIFDTIRAYAALRIFDAPTDSESPFDIFLSPDHSGLAGLLIKNSFARLVEILSAENVTACAINDEAADSDPGEETIAVGKPDVYLSLELSCCGHTAAATRRSLEQAIAMDVLATRASACGDRASAAEFRALSAADIAAIRADAATAAVASARPFIRERYL